MLTLSTYYIPWKVKPYFYVMVDIYWYYLLIPTSM